MGSMRRGMRRGNRRVGSGSTWSPRNLAGLALWLRGDMGLTVQPVSIAAYQDFTAAEWTKSNTTADNATTIRDTVDGAPTIHQVYISAAYSWLHMGAGTLTFRGSVGTDGVDSVLVYLSPGQYAIFNFTTGTVGSFASGCTGSIVDEGGGVFFCTLAATRISSGTNIQFVMCKSGTYSYTGTGNGTLPIWDQAIDQDPGISAWADQSGNGYDFSQATNTYRPTASTSSEGKPVVRFFGEYAPTQSLSRAYTAGLNTTTQTQFFVYKQTGAPAYAAVGVCRGPSGTSAGDAYISSSANLYSTWTASTAISPINVVTNQLNVYHWTHSVGVAADTMLRCNALDLYSGSPSAHADATVAHYIGTRSDGFTRTWGDVYEVIQYDRVLTAQERALVLAYLQKRYGQNYTVYSPADVEGIQSLLDASMGITMDGSNRISDIADQSGVGDANLDVAQPVGANQPLYVASDVNLGGEPSVLHDEARGDYLLSTAWATPLPNPSTHFAVAYASSVDSSGSVLNDGIAAGNRQATYYDIAPLRSWYAGTIRTAGAATVPGASVLVTVMSNTASAAFYDSAKTPVGSGLSVGANTLTGLTIGCAQGVTPGTFWDGSWSIQGKYDRVLATAEVNQLLDYCGERFGISIGA